jgi:hypothetical protein
VGCRLHMLQAEQCLLESNKALNGTPKRAPLTLMLEMALPLYLNNQPPSKFKVSVKLN